MPLGESKSGEILAILAVGVALAGVILTSSRGVPQDMWDMRQDMAHLEGLLEGLREAITVRAKAS